MAMYSRLDGPHLVFASHSEAMAPYTLSVVPTARYTALLRAAGDGQPESVMALVSCYAKV